jgi:hypothetical protein
MIAQSSQDIAISDLGFWILDLHGRATPLQNPKSKIQNHQLKYLENAQSSVMTMIKVSITPP